jgi:hypothetical protein
LPHGIGAEYARDFAGARVTRGAELEAGPGTVGGGAAHSTEGDVPVSLNVRGMRHDARGRTMGSVAVSFVAATPELAGGSAMDGPHELDATLPHEVSALELAAGKRSRNWRASASIASQTSSHSGTRFGATLIHNSSSDDDPIASKPLDTEDEQDAEEHSKHKDAYAARSKHAPKDETVGQTSHAGFDNFHKVPHELGDARLRSVVDCGERAAKSRRESRVVDQAQGPNACTATNASTERP